MGKVWISVIIGIIVVYIVIHYCNIRRGVGISDEAIRVLYRQSARYAYAAEQDESPIIRVLHANYGAGYLFALKDIVRSGDFERVVGEDMLTFEKRIVGIQDRATRELAEKCGERGLPKIDSILMRGMY
jgi:hypothetical protein